MQYITQQDHTGKLSHIVRDENGNWIEVPAVLEDKPLRFHLEHIWTIPQPGCRAVPTPCRQGCSVCTSQEN